MTTTDPEYRDLPEKTVAEISAKRKIAKKSYETVDALFYANQREWIPSALRGKDPKHYTKADHQAYHDFHREKGDKDKELRKASWEWYKEVSRLLRQMITIAMPTDDYHDCSEATRIDVANKMAKAKAYWDQYIGGENRAKDQNKWGDANVWTEFVSFWSSEWYRLREVDRDLVEAIKIAAAGPRLSGVVSDSSSRRAIEHTGKSFVRDGQKFRGHCGRG